MKELCSKGCLLIAFLILNYLPILATPIVINSEDFETCTPGAWTAVSVSGDDTWECNNDIDCDNSFYEMNGFGGNLDEDWLVSPAIDMDQYGEEYFCFQYRDIFEGPDIELFYSTNYSGMNTIPAINAAIWINIPLNLYDLSNDSWISDVIGHHAIDISNISGSDVYFAFKYINSSAESASWQIDNISITADYYEAIETGIANGTNCLDLKTELSNLINDHYIVPYTDGCLDVKKSFWATDRRMNDAGNATIVWDMFTDNPSGAEVTEFTFGEEFDSGVFANSEGVVYNREHTFPRAWWGGSTNYPSDTINFDLHHVTPSDKFMNAAKLSYPPGVVATSNITSSSGVKVGSSAINIPNYGSEVWEPIDAYKGDYARIYLYMVLRYGHYFSTWENNSFIGNAALSNNCFPGYEDWMIDMLLDWSANDPVSQKEIDRNNAIYCIQGNRNPFVDHPEYIQLIWGGADGTPCDLVALPLELISFSGEIRKQTIELNWETAFEENMTSFDLQKSRDAIDFKTIESIGAQNSIRNNYQSIDNNPFSGDNFYRLKMTDYFGSIKYSEILSFRFESTTSFDIYPTVATNVIYFSNQNESSTYQVIDIHGKIWKTINSTSSELQVGDFPSGHYFIRCEENGDVKRFVKL